MRKPLTALLGLVLAAGLLTGCGASSEKTEQGMSLIRNLDYQGAMAAFDSAEEAGENPRLIARGRGIALMGQTDYAGAVEAFRQALQLSDGFVQSVDYDLNYYMAAAYTKLGDYSEAEKAYDAILALEEQEDALFLRGLVRLYQDEFLGAREDFDRVVAMDPDNYDRIIDIYRALARADYREAGLEYLEAVLQRAESKMSSLDRGRIYYYMGEYQAAAAELETSRRESGDAESSLYLGLSYEAVSEYNYASNVYESYLAIDDSNAAIYNQLGLCRLETGNYASALENFEAGMALGDAAVMQSLSFNEIVAYEYLGEYQKAEVLMTGYLKSYPDDEAALREQIFLATR